MRPIPDPSGGFVCARNAVEPTRTTSHVCSVALPYCTTCRTLEPITRDGRGREGSYLDEEERLDLEGSANESTTISIATITVANAIRGRTRVGTHTT